MFSQLIKSILVVVILWILYNVNKLIQFIWKQKKILKAVEQFPMERKHWLRGHLDRLSGDDEDILSHFDGLMKKYPKACAFYFMNFVKPYVIVYHPDTVRPVMEGRVGKTTTLGMYGYGRQWYGDGLFLSNGKKWLKNRKLLTPMFHSEVLKQYFDVFNQATDIFLNKLLDLSKLKVAFEIHEIVAQLTVDVILRCAFSYHSGIQKQRKSHIYIKAANKLRSLWMKRHMEPWKHFDFIYSRTADGKRFSKDCQLVRSFTDNIVKERRKLIAEHPGEACKHHDFLDILLRFRDEDGACLTNDEIRDEVNTFIGAGYDTVASAASWFLYSIASNNHYQEKCHEEVDDLMRHRSNDHLKWVDVQKLPYLKACINETLRLYGPPIFERELEENLKIDGKMVPAGTLVMIHLYNLHRNPDCWKDATKFDPERFSKEKCDKMDPFAFIPFSTGPRNCIGQAFAIEELKVILVRTLNRFSFDVKENYVPIKSLAISLKSANGIHLKVFERKKQQ